MTKETIDEYKKINLDISNRIITLSLTVIASIFVICDKYGTQKWYLIAFLGFILTIGMHLISSICSSKHYELAIDGKIANVDFRNSKWGLWADGLYKLFIVLFVVSIIIFIIALIGSISVINYSRDILK